MTEAGWYPDPSGSGELRWFDGNDWTSHLAPQATAPQAAAAAPAPAPSSSLPPPPQSFGAPAFGAPAAYGSAATASAGNPLMGVVAGLIGAAVVIGVGLAAGADFSSWDSFDRTSFAIGGALYGAGTGIGLALVCARRFRRNPWPAAGLAVVGGAVGGVASFQILEDVTDLGITLLIGAAIVGVFIGGAFGLGVGGRPIVGGLVGGGVAWAIAGVLSGLLTEDIDIIRFPILGPEFDLDLDPAKWIAGVVIACVGTAVAIERTADST